MWRIILSHFLDIIYSGAQVMFVAIKWEFLQKETTQKNDITKKNHIILTNSRTSSFFPSTRTLLKEKYAENRKTTLNMVDTVIKRPIPRIERMGSIHSRNNFRRKLRTRSNFKILTTSFWISEYFRYIKATEFLINHENFYFLVMVRKSIAYCVRKK